MITFAQRVLQLLSRVSLPLPLPLPLPSPPGNTPHNFVVSVVVLPTFVVAIVVIVVYRQYSCCACLPLIWMVTRV
jgi:hypothetical protein